MSLSTGLSRVTGFVRLWAQAIALGATFFASSYVVANNIPNMLYELVAGGIISSLFIPVFMERRAKYGEKDARDFASSAFWLAVIALGLVSLAGTIWPQPFVYTQFAPGAKLDPQAAIFMFRFFAVQILIYGVGALITGILNSDRIFFAPAIGPVFNNLVVIATLFAFVPISVTGHRTLAIVVLAAGTTLGVVAQMAVQIPSLMKTGFRFRFELDLKHPGLRTIGLLAIPTVVYVITNLIGVTFRNRFAFAAPIPGLEAGSGPSIVSYAWVWYQLPYGIFAVALATALFPELSTAAHDFDWKRFAENFGLGLRTTALLILPCAALLIALAPQIISLFKFGRFTTAMVGPTAHVLQVWALGLFSFAAYMLVLRSFYSMQDTRTPAVTNVFATVLQVILYATLTQGLGWVLPWEAWGGIGLPGIPAADAIAYSLHLLLLGWLLRRQVGPLQMRRSVVSLAKSVLVAAAGGLAAWAVVAATPAFSASRFGFLAQILAGTVVAAGVVWGLARLLGVEEIQTVSRLVARLFGRLHANGA